MKKYLSKIIKYKFLLILIFVHFFLLILTLSGKLDFLFYDASELRKGRSADFYSVYQAGNNILENKSIYEDTEGTSTPYSYPYRYLPAPAYSFGLFFSLFSPQTAYLIWVGTCEILIFLSLYFLKKLIKDKEIFLMATITWLLFTPLFIEFFLGQWSFIMAVLLFFTFWGIIKKSKIQYLFSLAPLVKPNTLILLPVFLKEKKFKLIISTGLLIFFLSAPYFLFNTQDIPIFMENFSDNMYSYGGNLGFKSLFYIIYSRELGLIYPRIVFLIFSGVLGIFTLFLTYKSKSFLLSSTLWICFYFLYYKDVWEHHYVLLIPIFSLLIYQYKLKFKELLKKENLIFLISYLLISLPSIFFVQYFFVKNPPVEVDLLNPIYTIIYHSIKIFGVVLLYIWVGKRIYMRKF